MQLNRLYFIEGATKIGWLVVPLKVEVFRLTLNQGKRKLSLMTSERDSNYSLWHPFNGERKIMVLFRFRYIDRFRLKTN